MSTKILIALILSLSAQIAMAADDDEDTTPVLQTSTLSPKLNEGIAQPDFIIINDNLTDPLLKVTYGNPNFSIEITGAAQSKDQDK